MIEAKLIGIFSINGILKNKSTHEILLSKGNMYMAKCPKIPKYIKYDVDNFLMILNTKNGKCYKEIIRQIFWD